MAVLKPKRSFYRSRTAYSINRTIQPVVSADKKQITKKTIQLSSQRKSLQPSDTVLDCIINELKKDNKDQDILLIITPASRHANRFKLHAIQHLKQIHLGMTTVTAAELSHLRVSQAFQRYCIVFASRYLNLVRNEKIPNLISCLGCKCCSASKEAVLSSKTSLDVSKSNTSSAGDHFKNQALKTLNYANSFMQTEPDEQENTSFSLTDIYTLMETLNRTLQPSRKDIKRFFFMAEHLNFTLVVRPQLLWKTTQIFDLKRSEEANVLVESYLPGSSYVGYISVKENDLLQIFALYPKLLFSTHVIEDVFEITSLSKNFVMVLKKVLGFLGLELLYDAFGEFLFDCCKNFTYL